MQLIVNNVKKINNRIQKNCHKGKKTVGSYRNSIQARENLSILQKNMRKPLHKLTQDIETGWNREQSCFRLLKQKEPISTENSRIANFTER